MSRALRLFALIGLPLLTLILGIGLGATFERERFETQWNQISNTYSGKSGSGKTVQIDPEQEVDIGLLWEVWRRLGVYYIDPGELEVNTLVFGAVRGMVDSIGDPYTVFMTPSENQQFQSELNGTLEGIGAELTMRDGAVIVVSPLKGSPAQRAGILPEDIITKVNGQDLAGMSLNDVISRVRGKRGTQVKLEIYHKGDIEPVTITITRESIHIPAVESRVIETASGSVGYVSLNMFGSESIPEVVEALEAFDTDKIEGIILDLRFNGGGLLDGAVDLVSLFVAEGKVVTVEHRDQEAEVLDVKGRPMLPDMPLVVIINQGSASASEIVAGALQDYKRATIVGEQSFGKGTVQEVVDIPGGSSLRVTTARWLTPKGLNLGKKGVTPDVIVKRTAEQYQNEIDPQLDKAVELLLK